MEKIFHVRDCATRYQNREHGIYIPLDCFVVNGYFLSICDDRIAIALVGPGLCIASLHTALGTFFVYCLKVKSYLSF